MGWPKMQDSPRIYMPGDSSLSELTASICRMDVMAMSGGICEIFFFQFCKSPHRLAILNTGMKKWLGRSQLIQNKVQTSAWTSCS